MGEEVDLSLGVLARGVTARVGGGACPHTAQQVQRALAVRVPERAKEGVRGRWKA